MMPAILNNMLGFPHPHLSQPSSEMRVVAGSNFYLDGARWGSPHNAQSWLNSDVSKAFIISLDGEVIMSF